MTNGEKFKEVFQISQADKGKLVAEISKDWWKAEYKDPTTKNDLAVDSVDRGKEPCYTCRFCKINSHGSIYCSLREKGGKCYDHDSWESQEDVLDKIRAEITDCLKALDEIEKSGLNIYLPNEISGRRLTYQQCLEFIDKYKTESEK